MAESRTPRLTCLPPSSLLIAPILQMILEIYHHSISNQPFVQDGGSATDLNICCEMVKDPSYSPALLRQPGCRLLPASLAQLSLTPQPSTESKH